MIERAKAGSGGAPCELEVVKKNGERAPIELSIRLLRDRLAPVGVQGVARDIAERKRLEEQFYQAQKLEAVRRLAGGIAHDFNNLMGVVIGQTEIVLERMAPGDSLRRNLAVVKDAGVRAGMLTRQLMAFGRKQVLEPKAMSLNRVVESMSDMVRRMIEEDIEFLFIPGRSLETIKADPTQIEQVIMNLVVNARDAMANGGKLIIETANADLDDSYQERRPVVLPGAYVLLTVTDTGSGMNKETQARIFEPFFTTKGPGKGTGLGLASVYGIVKQSGGYIWVYSEPGQGTSFKIYFPVAKEPGSAVASPQAPREYLHGTEVILLIEDQDALREVTAEFLRSGGYRVLEASGARQALAIAQTVEDIHLIVSDFVMPEMSGKSVVEKISGLRSGFKVLFVSGYPEDRINNAVLTADSGAFLRKPFTRFELLERVRQVLDKPAS